MILFSLSFSSCSYLRELSSLSKCAFQLSEVDSFIFAGIPLDEIDSYSDLKIIQIGKITKAFADGALPLSFRIHVAASNPNSVTAAVNKIDYIAYIDEIEIAKGALNERVDVKPHGTSDIPLGVTLNLAEVFKKESMLALFNLALNLSDYGSRPTRISLKIKPYIKAGNKDLEYPGYINVKTDISSAGEE
jgi:LEA14-like dessication related protein